MQPENFAEIANHSLGRRQIENWAMRFARAGDGQLSRRLQSFRGVGFKKSLPALCKAGKDSGSLHRI